jgi:hypothetical protein
LYAHLIKIGGVVAIGVAFFVVNTEKAEAWTPCMPICDFACTAPAAISMSLSVLASHLELSKELIANIEEISNLSTSLVDRNASISAQETLNTNAMLTALDAASTKISTSFQRNAMEREISKNNHSIQLERLHKNKIIGNNADQVSKAAGQGLTDALLTSLAASSTIKNNNDLMDDLLLVSDHLQNNSNDYEEKDEFREKIGLLSDISHDIPNPFISDEVDIQFYKDYQKQITLLYNHERGEPKSIIEANNRIKFRIIIQNLNLHILENTTFDSNGLIEGLTMQSKATVARSKADAYKRLMLDKEALTSLDKQTKGSLLLTKVIINSQKNLLLNEILKVKKQKNLLLSLSML